MQLRSTGSLHSGVDNVLIMGDEFDRNRRYVDSMTEKQVQEWLEGDTKHRTGKHESKMSRELNPVVRRTHDKVVSSMNPVKKATESVLKMQLEIEKAGKELAWMKRRTGRMQTGSPTKDDPDPSKYPEVYHQREELDKGDEMDEEETGVEKAENRYQGRKSGKSSEADESEDLGDEEGKFDEPMDKSFKNTEQEHVRALPKKQDISKSEPVSSEDMVNLSKSLLGLREIVKSSTDVMKSYSKTRQFQEKWNKMRPQLAPGSKAYTPKKLDKAEVPVMGRGKPKEDLASRGRNYQKPEPKKKEADPTWA